ncbi:MAG TPA: 1,4-alpha-glucan branching protein GlgB [Verrucomicrobiales bacterium]|nr:1,4-alpha-glucan branching protein GlgB [Verrucomicrobiales bacterium]
MILTDIELNSLVNATSSHPHELLGMHPLASESGLVARAFFHNAKSVRIVPIHEVGKPSFRLKCIHDDGLFEGVTDKAAEVYSYEFKIVEKDGTAYSCRDGYSFLPTLKDEDLYLFGQGNHLNIFDQLGSQIREIDGCPGVSFAVWAPNAARISVVGDFNDWNGRRNQMRLLGGSGVWEIFIPGLGEGAHYKYEIKDQEGKTILKTDPYAFFFEEAPKNASIVWNNRKMEWTDAEWIEKRSQNDPLKSPISIYELHLGSWMKKNAAESLNYREIAEPLILYLQRMGFTHVELLPVAEHAFYPSWGYQVTGFFAPTIRYGTPDDFQFLVNELHQAEIGVIIDWVPAHFPRDDWALAQFDGTCLYEHDDPRQGVHQDWGTCIFNYGRHEVRNFLEANALFWCKRFHVDGLRVDAVASMLYLDYSRNEGEWVPNRFGGRENLEAVDFLKSFNHRVHTECPGVLTIAEESTAWPQVTRPPYLGGLGFTFKWNMGWMHDTLNYFSLDPVFRKYHQNDLTFAMLYHNTENFILPLSHDEVVHGKGSLVRKMLGDDWQRFANLRSLLGYQWLFPGKKLLFMGGEIGQSLEWNPNSQLEWDLLNQGPFHVGLQKWMEDLNHFYKDEPALWDGDYDHQGFQWIDCGDNDQSIYSFVRRSSNSKHLVVVVLNLTPVCRGDYRIGFPIGGTWLERLNSDSSLYAGSNVGNGGQIETVDSQMHGQPASAVLALPPLSVTAFIPKSS